MKTSYQRELKRNYLIVEMEKSDTREEPPFEQKMLEQNQIDGILRFQVRQKDEVIILGDFSYGKPDETNAVLHQLHGRLYLISGNHDRIAANPKYDQQRFGWIKDYEELKDEKRKVFCVIIRLCVIMDNTECIVMKALLHICCMDMCTIPRIRG